MSLKDIHVRWGIIEVIFVFLGLFLTGALFSIYGQMIYEYIRNLFSLPDLTSIRLALGFFFQFIVIIFLVFFLTLGINRARFKDLGFRVPRFKDLIQYGIMGGFLLFLCILVMGWIIQMLQPQLQPQLFEETLRLVQGPPEFILLFVLGVILAPVSEELFYRGMVYPVLRKHLGVVGGAILTGVVFGLAHFDLWRAIPLALGGAVLCYFYEKSGSIYVPMVAHGLWNGIMTLIVYYQIMI